MINDFFKTIFESISQPVYADALTNVIAGNIENASQANDLPTLVNQIIYIAVPAGVLVAILLFSYAAYLMITSKGNPEKLNEVKEIVTNAVVGFALIVLSVAILLLIKNTLNIPGI